MGGINMPEIIILCIAGGALVGALATAYAYYLYQLYQTYRR